ncbi:hypothetical protein Peur_048276 [Populus x canadensis]
MDVFKQKYPKIYFFQRNQTYQLLHDKHIMQWSKNTTQHGSSTARKQEKLPCKSKHMNLFKRTPITQI